MSSVTAPHHQGVSLRGAYIECAFILHLKYILSCARSNVPGIA
jgi:hypothetical protein